MTRGFAETVPDPGTLLVEQERERLLAKVLRGRGWGSLEDMRLFDAGCGSGDNLRLFTRWGARPSNLMGMDSDPELTAYCVSRSPEIRIHTGNAERVPEPDRSFDVSLAFTLFSTVHDEELRSTIAAEMFRVTKPGGLILVYDRRRADGAAGVVTPADIRRWFPKCPARVHRLTLGHALTSAAGRFAPWAYGALAAIPLLRTHLLIELKRPAQSIFD